MQGLAARPLGLLGSNLSPFLFISVSASIWQPACGVGPTSAPLKLYRVLFLPGCSSASFHIVSSRQNLPVQCMWFVVEGLTGQRRAPTSPPPCIPSFVLVCICFIS